MNPPVAGALIASKYRIVRLIGDGGMGVVYEARHELLGSHVALKFLHAELAKRPGLAQRFLQEARVSAAIQSPHVTRVTDVDTADDGSPFLVMELLSGESLQGLLDRRGKLPPAQAIDFAIQIAAGLEAAHAIGVVHRDLKPDNVFVTPGTGGPSLKLIDFGIAKLRASTEFGKGLTRQGVIMGTPEYMAPEQLFAASEVDHRADIYSLGVMLFEMLSGVRAADGNDVDAIVAAVSAGHVRKLGTLEPALPLELDQIVERAMRPNREERQASAGELRLALVPFASELSHAGRLASVAAPLAPGRAPPSESLAELPPQLGVLKTEPPDDTRPPPGMSQLFSARTSLADPVPAAQVGAGYGPPPARYGAPPAPYGALPAQYGPPPPTYGVSTAAFVSPPQPLHYGAPPQPYMPAPRAKRRRGPLLVALVVIVVGGGAAVGYAAFLRLSTQPIIPPLPDATFIPEGEAAPIETIAPLETAPLRTDTTPLRSPAVAPRPVAGGVPALDAGVPATTTTAAGGAPPAFQLPFPLPSNLSIPTALPTAFPSTIALPSGFPTAFPSSFPGFPGQTPEGAAAPAGGTGK